MVVCGVLLCEAESVEVRSYVAAMIRKTCGFTATYGTSGLRLVPRRSNVVIAFNELNLYVSVCTTWKV